MKKLIIVILITFCATYAFANGNGKGGSERSNNSHGNNGNISACLESLPYSELDADEIESIRYMIEEEKLARDVYLNLYEHWGIRVFRNISKSEQNHMDALAFLIDRYGLEDPTQNNDSGVFSDSGLQNLYNTLVEQGSVSMIDALKVGASIEDLDIYDLQQELLVTDNEDVKTVFQNLLKGSRNHLRSFTLLLERNGESYAAQYLTQEEVDQIIASEKERGFVNADGEYVGNCN